MNESSSPPLFRRNLSSARGMSGNIPTSASSTSIGAGDSNNMPTGLGERRASELLARQFSKGLNIGAGDDEEDLEMLTESLTAATASVYGGVLKLFVSHCSLHYLHPWAKMDQFSSIGSAFCIDKKKKYLLTNAHCVEDAVMIQCLRRGETKKYFAKALCVADSCDLALLTVEADSFWEGMPELPLSSEMCRLQDTVSVIGYPLGGSNISLTQGVVSRIDLTDFSQSFGTQSLLTVQIDAAINSGNSGGPVLSSDLKVVGVAFQGMSKEQAESVGYVIPVMVVQRFLDDYAKNGKFTGFPTLGIECQSLENDDLREMHNMTEEQTGILIRAVAPEMEVSRVLKVDDVLLSVEGQQVGNDGSVQFVDGERIQVTHLLTSKFRGETIQVEVLRDGETLALSYMLEPPALLIPPKPAGPSYFIVAGLVILPLSMELLNQKYFVKRFGDSMVPPALKSLEQYCRFKDEECVVLDTILRHEANAGYQMDDLYRLARFNGKEVRNLAHLVSLVEGCEETWAKFEFDGTKDMIVLKTNRIAQTTEEVCVQNMIPARKYVGGGDDEKAADAEAEMKAADGGKEGGDESSK